MNRNRHEHLAWVIFHLTCINVAAGVAGYIWGAAPWPYVLIVFVLWLGNLCALATALRP